MHNTLTPGAPFPDLTLKTLHGPEARIGTPDPAHGDWQLVVVYRGKHCPICEKYLSELTDLLPDFHDIGVDVIAVSADPLDKTEAFIADIGYEGRVGYDLTIEQMQALGLYISDPRSPQETDRPFAEPAVFVVRDDRTLQIVDVSNAPFSRPALTSLRDGLGFIREKDYPIRGTHAAA